MNLQLEPLPGDVAHLLLRGATTLEPSAHTRTRLRRRLASEMSGRGGVTLALAPRRSLEGLAGRAVRSRFLIGMASFALGVGAAPVLGHRGSPAPLAAVAPAVAAPAEMALDIALQPAPVITPASVLPPKPRSPPAPRAIVAVRATLPVASTAPLMPRPLKSELRLEGELLERGRIAMVRGDAEGALEAADEHALRYPSGRLAEEREALRVQALASEDRLPEARAALSAFRRAYPQSLAGSALEAAVAGRLIVRRRKGVSSGRDFNVRTLRNTYSYAFHA